MSEPQKEPKSFFEKPIYRIGFPILVFALIGLLYLYSVKNPITDAKSVLTAFPASPPSVSSGKDIYGFFCASCHGKKGAPAEGLTFKNFNGKQLPPADLADPEFVHRHSPQIFFAAVSNGRDDVMPGFKTRASEAKRWDVTMFSYLMHFDPADITTGAGKKFYESNCADCHGVGGKGDGRGASADKPVPDLTDQKMMVKRTDNDLFEPVRFDNDGIHKNVLMMNHSKNNSASDENSGGSDADKDQMNSADAEGMQISDDDLYKIIGYIRTLGLSDASKIGE